MIWQLFYRLRENKQVTSYHTYLHNARRINARSATVDLKGDADSAYSYFVPRIQDRLQCIYIYIC